MGETDLISRQAAVDALAMADANRGWRLMKFSEIQGCLLALPSVQPERWIPCSERLPDAQTEVIVSCMDDSGDTRFLYTSSGWVTTNGEYWIVDNEINSFVIAWMPLPDPYKEEKL